jgi:transposase-like protein
MEVVLELLRGGDAPTISRSHGISQSQLFSWRDRFLEGGRTALRVRRGSPQDSKIRQLERLVGRLAMEKEILKKTEELRQRPERSKP